MFQYRQGQALPRQRHRHRYPLNVKFKESVLLIRNSLFLTGQDPAFTLNTDPELDPACFQKGILTPNDSA
jgi:CTP synthase (UTP-ammonia lyase)